ncbi:hypothetical protein [Prevotella pallens]|uniref:hypothetical protein n=1 Tax=Prevotella pallens TaxID=60133 RepID=UPI0023F48AEE|nr:hypothetical protein [Prevotella pallens]
MHEFIVLQSSEYRYSRCLGASVFICFVATIGVTELRFQDLFGRGILLKPYRLYFIELTLP